MPTHQSLSKAARLWNLHTSPSQHRSDFEHSMHGKAARKVMAFIKRHFLEGADFTFSAHSGKILPMRERIYIDER